MFPTTNFRTSAERPSGDRVGQAIAAASARTGVDFRYLMSQARIESGFNPTAKARTSSATGLYQFIDQTWLGTVKDHGAQHGLGWAAEAIGQHSNGHYYVADSAARAAILDLRNQPEAASAMAAEYAAGNRAHLESRLGRPVESVDLYLAHFLGPAGAEQFLTAFDADPSTAAAAILPQAAKANRSIFYREDGSARSVAEIRADFAAKLGDGTERPMPAQAFAQRTAFPPSDAAPRRFGAAREGQVDTGIRPIARPSAEFARISYEMLSNIGRQA
ncbi:transglycosylase SLT domain-containing protein [Allosphingosinicella flava]|uniref:Transglycosylase SLT domain-containing protein n=1 Tax=Allosphingosinicella flava TaxID=2771430 RepID=A0A7T2LMA4_9SPHN|nr:transglycosylase SLT domain-containing protein [Sphingosinicella flava]QPQ55344.1 transglycosylase SLT domain-containing protein [Sphingosinicella flava]